jgi:tetratricopeptide (TPR) repeat protein
VGDRGRGAIHVSTASEFLADLPDELDALLKWYDMDADPAMLAKDVRAYADGLLAALRSDQAIVPELQADPERILALVLTHHVRNPEHSVGWLNLGLALRRLAAWDSEMSRTRRLERAISCFDRCLALRAGERAVNVRAWAGKTLAFMQLGDLNEAVRCSVAALKLDRSDPNLWLLHSGCVGRAGNEDEALRLIENAYEAYVAAGRPDALRHLFDQHGSQAVGT